jgi:hypothetical protein
MQSKDPARFLADVGGGGGSGSYREFYHEYNSSGYQAGGWCLRIPKGSAVSTARSATDLRFFLPSTRGFDGGLVFFTSKPFAF